MISASTVAALPLPPGPRGLPVFGSLLGIQRKPHLSIDRLARRYGDVCLLRFGSVPTVIISHPDLLQEAFRKTEFSDRWVSEVMDILSQQKDLAMAPYGEHWRQLQRFANRELLSTRNLDRVRSEYIEDTVNGLVAGMGEIGDAGQPISPHEMLAQSNSTLMFRALFGRDEDDTAEFRQLQDELLDFTKWFFANAGAANPADYVPLLRFLPNNVTKEAHQQRRISREITDALLEGARNRPGLDLDNPSCLVEVMLAKEADGAIDNTVTADLCMDLILGGTDTSAQTVNWFLLIMANRPEVQNKVYEELDRVIGRDATPTVADRTRLPYTFACLSEAMRYRTIGPLGLPHQASVDTEIGGYLIPAGAQVLGNIYFIHHDPRFWDAPDEYIPERFMPQADGSPAAALTSTSFIPFGTGYRRCPGKRFAETAVWLYVTRIMQRYHLAPPGGIPLSEDEVFGLAVSPKPYNLEVSRW